MIEKILDRLEEEKDDAYADFEVYVLARNLRLDTEYDDFFHRGLERAKAIVQEVAKEYEEKKYYRITLSCLEDSTNLEMPLTKQEYLLLTRISDLVYRVATGCMPTMYVEEKGE